MSGFLTIGQWILSQRSQDFQSRMLTPSVRRRDGRAAWTSLVVSAWFSAPRSLKQEPGVSVCRPDAKVIWRERMEQAFPRAPGS